MNETRTVQFTANFPAEGEFTISLELSLRITVGNNSEVVTVNRKFATHSQNPNIDFVNPDGDLIRLRGILPQLEATFIQQCVEVENRLFQDYNPDGWMNL